MRSVAVAGLLALAACGGGGLARVPIGDSPQKGPADAWVTVVEFADFQCPYCSRAAPTVRRILETWPDEVRVVFKHLPLDFHARAMPAALAAQCAHLQGRFWPMHDALFAEPERLADADLEGHAAALGLELSAWRACLAAEATRDRVDEDRALAVDVEVGGTPAFYVNGREIAGAQPFETFRALIEQELATAKASGLERAEYYERAVLGR